MKFFRVLPLVLLFAGVLSGCVTSPTVRTPMITFTHLQPYSLAVNQVRVEQSFKASQTAPRIELRLEQSPTQVLRRWAADRLTVAGAGTGGFARFDIIDASVTEQALDTDGNFTAYFTNEQAVRYEAVAEAVLEINADDGMSQGSARARVVKVITIPEKASLNDRERALFGLVESLMKEFDLRMDENIRTHLSTWLR